MIIVICVPSFLTVANFADLLLVQLPRKLKAQISNILWSGVGWTCSKQLMHYPSFIRAGITISVSIYRGFCLPAVTFAIFGLTPSVSHAGTFLCVYHGCRRK